MNRIGLVLITLMLLGGCAHSGWAPPSVDVPRHWSAPVQAATAPAQHLNSDWWTRFNDPGLTAVINEALAASHDLAAATLRMKRARLQAGLANTTLTPDVNVSAQLGASRNLNTRHGQRSARVSGSLSYDLDFWGKQAQRRTAAAWEARAAEAERAQKALELIGATAALYWKFVYLNEQITDRIADLHNARKNFSIVQTRYAAGAVSGLDRARAEQNVSNQQLIQSQLYQQRVETQHAIAVLLNRPPEYRFDTPQRLSDMPLPLVPAGLPVDVLNRRPDLKAAEWRLRASFARIEEARTSFYPNFTLTGSLGSTSDALRSALQNPIAVLGVGLTLPFIQWNTMRLKLSVSENEYEEAVVHFRQKLYVALSEVEDALSERAQLLSEAEQHARIVSQARQIEARAQVRFNAGATDIQPWLEAQDALRNAHRALRKNRLQQLNNRVKLYQALGGA